MISSPTIKFKDIASSLPIEIVLLLKDSKEPSIKSLKDKVVEAENANAALDILREEKIDLVVTAIDIAESEMDGYGLLENIKSQTIFVNKKKNKEIKNIAESLIVKKIEIKATELKKNQSLLFKPKNLPSEFKLKVKNKIDEQKKELKNFYSDPYKLIKSKKAQKWVGLQVVKVFLGIPIMPGK